MTDIFSKINELSYLKIRSSYALRNNNIYFLDSSRPTKRLTEQEENIFLKLKRFDGDIKLSNIIDEWKETINSFVSEGIADIFTPDIQVFDRHIVVIEPHMDDAILSVGGQLLLNKGTCKVTIVCIFGISNYTSYMECDRAYLDTSLITKIRHDESLLAASKIGADFISLDFLDAPLRMQQSSAWTKEFIKTDIKKCHAFITSHPDPDLVGKVAASLDRIFKELKPDEIWFPLGLGDHVDHKTTRSACLELLSPGIAYKECLKVRLYEDLPYSSVAHRQLIQAAFAGVGSKLEKNRVDISAVIQSKIDVCSVYLSQFKIEFIAPELIKAGALVASKANFSSAGEQYYSLKLPFHKPPELLLSLQRNESLDQKSCALAFSRSIDKFKSLNIIIFPSGISGNNSETTKFIQDKFKTKETLFIFITSDKNKAVFKDGNSCVKYCGKYSVSLLYLILKILFTLKNPLIIVKHKPSKLSFTNYLFLKFMQLTRPVLVTPSLPNLSTYLKNSSPNL